MVMPSLPDIVSELGKKVDESVSLVVARTGAEGTLDARKIILADDASDSFRDLCRDAIESLAQRTVVAYTADAELTGSETFVIDDEDTLDELVGLRALATQASTLPTTAPQDLDVAIQMYAVVVGDDTRAVFVRRADPTMTFKAGRFLAVGQQQLRLLEEPVFGFSPGFDLVITDEWAVVLNQSAFERLYRDIGLIEQHVAEWVKGITDHLPMTEDSVAVLKDVAVRDSRTWRKLREIRRRGHLAGIDLKEVRKYAKQMGLDPKKVVQDDQLVFDPAERFSFLHLLNEDLYKGPLTDEAFEAQRKAPV